MVILNRSWSRSELLNSLLVQIVNLYNVVNFPKSTSRVQPMNNEYVVITDLAPLPQIRNFEEKRNASYLDLLTPQPVKMVLHVSYDFAYMPTSLELPVTRYEIGPPAPPSGWGQRTITRFNSTIKGENWQLSLSRWNLSPRSSSPLSSSVERSLTYPFFLT